MPDASCPDARSPRSLLVLLAAAPVSAAPPTKEPQPPVFDEFAAGDVCDFAIRVESLESKAKSIAFDRRDGALKVNLSGSLVEQLTNLDTGASVVRQSSGPAKVSLNAPATSS